MNARGLPRVLSIPLLALVALVTNGCAQGVRSRSGATPIETPPAFHEVVVPHGAWFEGAIHRRLAIRFVGHARAPAGELAKAMREGVLAGWVDLSVEVDEAQMPTMTASY